MQITSATSPGTSPLATLSNSSTNTRTPTQSLGEADFLKLLSVQFQQQDPMKPMDDTAFIAQTAQFTSLQQMTQLSQGQQMLNGNSFIGRNVTIQNPDGTQVTGLVTALDNTGTAPALVINGTSYPLTTVKRIEAGVTAPAAPATSSSTSPTAPSTDSSTVTPPSAAPTA
jgi:flagellar basal-body rod modification protein FlgD